MKDKASSKGRIICGRENESESKKKKKEEKRKRGEVTTNPANFKLALAV